MCSFYYSQWQSILYHMISCQCIVLMYRRGFGHSGVYTIYPAGTSCEDQPEGGGNRQCVQWLDLLFIVFWASSQCVSLPLPQGSIHVVVCSIILWSRECYQPGEMDKHSPSVEHLIFLWKISKCPSIPGVPGEKGWDSELLPWMGPIQEWVWAVIWRVLVR